MTMPLEETYVSVDVEEDTASDDREHFTHSCYWPDRQPRPEPVMSWCGEMFVTRGEIFWGVHEGECEDCSKAVRTGKPCPRGCGWSYRG